MASDRFFRRFFSFGVWLMKPFMRGKFNFSWESLKNIQGPYLLLCNHNTDWDPILLSIAASNHVYFVMTENALRKPFYAFLLKTFLNPIVHLKGRKSGKSTMDILRALKRGCSVALFAEGNRSFDGITGEIPEVTGKLARKCGVRVVTYRLEGGYLSQPRWSRSLRKGELCGKLVHVYEPEELQTMTDGEVQQAICSDLHENIWERQNIRPVAYRGKKLAEGLETALYCCPCCHAYGTLTSTGARLQCSCGYFADMDEYGFLTEANGTRRTIAELIGSQREVLSRSIHSGNTEALFSDSVQLGEVVEHRLGRTVPGILTAYPDRVEWNGSAIAPSSISGLAIFSRNKLTVHTDGGAHQLELTGNKTFNALKYSDYYHILSLSR